MEGNYSGVGIRVDMALPKGSFAELDLKNEKLFLPVGNDVPTIMWPDFQTPPALCPQWLKYWTPKPLMDNIVFLTLAKTTQP